MRPQTYESEAEAEVLSYVFAGRSGLENTSFALLGPDGKKISRGARSPSMVYGSAEGGPAERRVYMVVAILSWVAVYLVHWPLPGPTIAVPEWLAYLGGCAFLMSFLAFTEGTTFEGVKAFAGVPGYGQTHGAAGDAPLQTEGSYASVRHPM